MSNIKSHAARCWPGIGAPRRSWQPRNVESALAQQAAGKTIQFILPVAVASGVDTIVRSAQNELTKALGATVVVNNQPGAGDSSARSSSSSRPRMA